MREHTARRAQARWGIGVDLPPRIAASDDAAPHLDACNAEILAAKDTLGSDVLPVHKSRSVEYAMPSAAANSLSVMPEALKSSICDSQIFMMDAIERKNAPNVKRKSALAIEDERHSVTELRQTPRMHPRDPETERRLAQAGQLPGPRIRYLMKVRGMTQLALAKAVGYKGASSVRSLLSGDVIEGKKLHEIAQALRASYAWIAHGKGDPEATAHPQAVALPEKDWPLPSISRDRIDRLDEIELGFFQSELVQLLDKIDAARRRRRA